MTFDWSRRLGQPAALLRGRRHDHLADRASPWRSRCPAGSCWRCCGCRRFAPVGAPATAFVEFFRATPLILQIYWAFYVLPVIARHPAVARSRPALVGLAATSRPSTPRRSAPASTRSARASGMPALALGMSRAPGVAQDRPAAGGDARAAGARQHLGVAVQGHLARLGHRGRRAVLHGAADPRRRPTACSRC